MKATAGRRTRRGNIRCRSVPISALSCAVRVSSSIDLALECLENVQPERAGEIARFAARLVDLGHQSAQRKAPGLGQRGQLAPEGVLERDARLMAADGDRAFAHSTNVPAARRPLNLPCRCHGSCVYTAPKNPSRTTNGYPQR